MATKTLIAWCDHTFNAWMGCTKVSAGCDRCYAETLTRNRMGLDIWGPNRPRQVTSDDYWRKPTRWNADAARQGLRRRVFCGSLMDWAEKHPVAEATRPRLWKTIQATPWLDWLLLTKRPGRIAGLLPIDWGEGYDNVWLGTSIEDMRVAWRSDHLRVLPAIVRFVSYEPALGPLDGLDLTGIDWMIYGGESGPGFRPEGVTDDHHVWARTMRDRCREAGTAFFFKQSAALRTETGTTLDGETIREYPLDRSPRGFEVHGASSGLFTKSA